MNPFSEIRTLVVADSPLARAGLAALLEGSDKINIVGSVSDETDLVDTVAIYRPDVILWDMVWEPLAALERVAELGDSACVIALAADHGTALEAAPALLGAGVKGILLQSASSEAIAAAIFATSQGLLILDRGVSASMHPNNGGTDDNGGLIEQLTTRELEVVALIAEGLPNKSIALKLGISEHTVKFHVNAILTKLSAQSRTEAVVRATRLGLITL